MSRFSIGNKNRQTAISSSGRANDFCCRERGSRPRWRPKFEGPDICLGLFAFFAYPPGSKPFRHNLCSGGQNIFTPFGVQLWLCKVGDEDQRRTIFGPDHRDIIGCTVITASSFIANHPAFRESGTNALTAGRIAFQPFDKLCTLCASQRIAQGWRCSARVLSGPDETSCRQLSGQKP